MTWRSFYRPDRHKLDWFLGFFEGRACVQPPQWWADVVRNAEASSRDSIRFDLPGQPECGERKSLYHNSGLDEEYLRALPAPTRSLSSRLR